MLPEEQPIEAVSCKIRNIEGLLVITDIRFLWKRTRDTNYSISEYRMKIKYVQRAEDNKVDNRFVIRIQMEDPNLKPYHFSFQGIQAKVES